MARRRRGHKRSKDEIKTMARKAMGYVKIAVGTVGFGHGAINAALTSRDGTWNLFPNRVIYNYTGYNPGDGSFNQNQLFASVATFAGTAVVVKMLSWGQKQLR